MSEAKYSTLKKAVAELSKIYGNEAGIQAINDLLPVMDSLEEKQQEKAILTKQEIMAIKDPTKRIKAIQDNSNLFK